MSEKHLKLKSSERIAKNPMSPFGHFSGLWPSNFASMSENGLKLKSNERIAKHPMSPFGSIASTGIPLMDADSMMFLQRTVFPEPVAPKTMLCLVRLLESIEKGLPSEPCPIRNCPISQFPLWSVRREHVVARGPLK